MRTLKLLVALIVIATPAACGSPDEDGSALDTLEPPPSGEVQDSPPPGASTSTSGAASGGPVVSTTTSTTVLGAATSTSNPGRGNSSASTGAATGTTQAGSTTETTRATGTTGAAQTSTTQVSASTRPSGPPATTSPPIVTTPPKKAQTISFAQPSGPWAYGESKVIVASASSGLPLAYEATGACVVDNAVLGVFRAIDVGACRITASQAGDASWQPAAPVTRPMTISKATPIIQGFADQSIAYLRHAFQVALAATATGGATVKYRTLPDANGYEFCTVTADQLQIPETGGLPETCVVEAYVEESRLFAGQSATAHFTITPTVVRFLGHSIGAISDTSVTVSVSLNLVWDIGVDSDCGTTSDSFTGKAQYQLTFVVTPPATRPVPCTITVATAFVDQAHTLETKIITIPPPSS